MQLVRGVSVMLALAAAACSAENGRVRKRECEAVLAHLTALEKGESDQPMCKYHPDCAGDQAERFERNCQKVLTQGQADCYLRSTSLDDADDCLRRDRFDDELRTGRRKGDKSSGGDPDDPWFGGGGGHDSSPIGQMKDIRDEACACKDKRCADGIQKRFEEWARDNASLTTGSSQEEVSKIAMEASECMVKAMTSDYSYGYYDAGVPDAYRYYVDPYASPGSTGMAACDEYLKLYDRLMLCDKYPQSARDAMKQSIDQMRQTWGDPSYMSDSVKQSTNDSCRMMIDGLRDGMTAMGCP